MKHALHEHSWRPLPSVPSVDLVPGDHPLKGVPYPLPATFPPQAGESLVAFASSALRRLAFVLLPISFVLLPAALASASALLQLLSSLPLRWPSFD